MSARDMFGEPLVQDPATTIRILLDELAAAREAVGAGWLAGGVSLAEGIERKTAALERSIHDQARLLEARGGRLGVGGDSHRSGWGTYPGEHLWPTIRRTCSYVVGAFIV